MFPQISPHVERVFALTRISTRGSCTQKIERYNSAAITVHKDYMFVCVCTPYLPTERTARLGGDPTACYTLGLPQG